MFHEWLKIWFAWVEHWGYLGVFAMMAVESSVFPLPSEIVMPPAAFWAAQGKMDFWLVVATGTAGSYAGSCAMYFLSRALGIPFLKKYGRFVGLNDEKWVFAEGMIRDHGAFGVFASRLLPVVRHLNSIPAGVLRMPFGIFSASTILGSFAWCAILSWFGAKVIGDRPELLQSPGDLVLVLKERLHYFVFAVAAFAVLYAAVSIYRRRQARRRAA